MTRVSEQEIILASLASLSAPALYAQENPGVVSEASDLRLQDLAQGRVSWDSLNEAERITPRYVVAALCWAESSQQTMVLQQTPDYIFASAEFIQAIPDVVRALPITLIPSLPLDHLGSHKLSSETLDKISDCREMLLSTDINHPALSKIIQITQATWKPNYDLRSKFISLAADIKTLPLLPPELSKYPDVQLHVRDILNRELCDQQIDQQQRILSIDFISDWYRVVPEVLRFHSLSQDAGGVLNVFRESQSEYYRWNCGALDENLFARNKNIPSQLLQAAGQTQAMLESFGIFGVRRFDNSAEIILNRFELLSPQAQIRFELQFGNSPILLLPPRASSVGSSEVEKSEQLDRRPYALIVAVRPAADHNGVFDCINMRGPSRDYIDRLTVGYKVLYFEVNGADEFFKAVAYVANKLPEKIELFLPMAHGFETEMVWGEFWSGHESLEAKDESLKELTNLMKPGGTVGLISCSTAGSPQGDQKSVFEQYIEVFPACYVYGPTRPTLLPNLELDKQGGFLGLKYIDLDSEVQGLLYNPTTKTITSESGVEPTDDLPLLVLPKQFEFGFRMGMIFTAVGIAVLSGVAFITNRASKVGQYIKNGLKEARDDKSFLPGFRRGPLRAFISGFFGSKTE